MMLIKFIIQFLEMAIWEPCNYVSNLAYDRLVVEMCNQDNWILGTLEVKKIAEAFALVTFGSSFMHGSETLLGGQQDLLSDDLFTYILHQVKCGSLIYTHFKTTCFNVRPLWLTFHMIQFFMICPSHQET